MRRAARPRSVCRPTKRPMPCSTWTTRSPVGEARDFRNEIVELAGRLARPHQAVAENVLLGDDRDVVGLETGSPCRRTASMASLRGVACTVRQVLTLVRLSSLWSRQHAAPCGRASLRSTARSRPSCAAACSAMDVRHHGFEHVDCRVGALGREIAALPRAGVDHALHRPSGTANGVSRASAPSSRRFVPLVFGQVEPVRRQRLVDRAAAGMFQRLARALRNSR